jgi:hypothetical protein
MRFFLPTAVVLATAAGVAAHVVAPGPAPQDGRMELIASVNHTVSVKTSPVTGLYPGEPPQPLTLRIKNTYGYAVKITAVKTKLAAATNRPGCTGTRANLVVSHKAGAIVIKPKKTAAVVMTVVMPPTVADACQGATFRMTFTARAVRA